MGGHVSEGRAEKPRGEPFLLPSPLHPAASRPTLRVTSQQAFPSPCPQHTHTHRTCLLVVYFISLFILDPCPPGVIHTGKCVCCLVMSDFVTSRTVSCQAPLSVEFSRQEHWSGLPFPSPGDLPNPGIKPRSPALQADSLPMEPPGEPPSSPLACTL